MSAALRRAVALAATALALAGCGRPPFRVVLLGDSITVGMQSEPTGPSYGALLAEQLGKGFEIVNVACGGSSSLDWRPGAPAAVCDENKSSYVASLYEARARPALPADVVTVLLGTNDTLGHAEPAPVEPQAYEDALRELVTALHADGARDVILIPPPPILRQVHRFGALRARALALCGSEPWLHCGPDLTVVLDSSTDFAPHKVHPNASGHVKIAAALAPMLRELASQRR